MTAKTNGEGNRKQERVRDDGKNALHILAGERTAGAGGKARALSSGLEGTLQQPPERLIPEGVLQIWRSCVTVFRGAGCSTLPAMLPALSDSTPGAGKSSLTDLPNTRFESREEPACVQIPPGLAEVISSGKVTHRRFYPFVYF